VARRQLGDDGDVLAIAGNAGRSRSTGGPRVARDASALRAHRRAGQQRRHHPAVGALVAMDSTPPCKIPRRQRRGDARLGPGDPRRVRWPSTAARSSTWARPRASPTAAPDRRLWHEQGRGRVPDAASWPRARAGDARQRRRPGDRAHSASAVRSSKAARMRSRRPTRSSASASPEDVAAAILYLATPPVGLDHRPGARPRRRACWATARCAPDDHHAEPGSRRGGHVVDDLDALRDMVGAELGVSRSDHDRPGPASTASHGSPRTTSGSTPTRSARRPGRSGRRLPIGYPSRCRSSPRSLGQLLQVRGISMAVNY